MRLSLIILCIVIFVSCLESKPSRKKRDEHRNIKTSRRCKSHNGGKAKSNNGGRTDKNQHMKKSKCKVKKRTNMNSDETTKFRRQRKDGEDIPTKYVIRDGAGEAVAIDMDTFERDYKHALQESRRRYLYRDNIKPGHDAPRHRDNPRGEFHCLESSLLKPKTQEYLLEGDISKVPNSQLIEKRGGKRRLKRGYSHDFLWPFNTPIHVWINSTSFRNAAVVHTKVQNALDDFWRNTCLEFRVSLTRPAQYHIIVQGHAKGCYANVGFQDNQNYQIVNLSETSLCLSFGLIQHEMAHAIGLEHEQRRYDSNDYIYYHPENTDYNELFITRSIAEHSIVTPYDVSSVMHYSPLAFTSNNYKTITAKQAELDELMGSYTSASFFDYVTMNSMYKCASGCHSITCENSGYAARVGGRCQCVCPEYLGGMDCSEMDTPCGGVVHVDINNPYTILSPNRGGNTPIGHKCIWLLKEREKKPLRATFDELFELKTDCELEIRANHIQQPAPLLYYGDEAPMPISTRRYRGSHLMMVIFDTTHAFENVAGFNLTVATDFDGCVGDPCLGARCKSSPGSTEYKCRPSAEVHCSFSQGLTGPCRDIRLNYLPLESNIAGFAMSVTDGGVTALADWSALKKRGALGTIPQKIHGEGCIVYQYDMRHAERSVLELYQYNGRQKVALLAKHTSVDGKGRTHVPFSASRRDLTEIVFEFHNSEQYAYESPITIHEIHVVAQSCPTGACENFPCGSLSCYPTAIGKRCLMPDREIKCDFSPDCFYPYHQVDILQQPGATARWSPNRETTPTPYTGPNKAYAGEYYIYAEASQNSHQVATMVTQPLEGGSNFCITFMYHMYGVDIGKLHVYMMIDQLKSSSPIWTGYGSMLYSDCEWKQAEIEIANHGNFATNAQQNIQFAFDAVFGEGPYGDIAVDELSVTPALCIGL